MLLGSTGLVHSAVQSYTFGAGSLGGWVLLGSTGLELPPLQSYTFGAGGWGAGCSWVGRA